MSFIEYLKASGCEVHSLVYDGVYFTPPSASDEHLLALQHGASHALELIGAGLLKLKTIVHDSHQIRAGRQHEVAPPVVFQYVPTLRESWAFAFPFVQLSSLGAAATASLSLHEKQSKVIRVKGVNQCLAVSLASMLSAMAADMQWITAP